MKKPFICLISALILLSGCVTAPVRPTIKDTEIFQADFDRVWKSTIATIADMALPVESIEKESGLVTTKFVSFSFRELHRIAQTPSIGLGVWSTGRYTLSIFMVSISETATKVKIKAHVEAFERNVTKSWHVCYSKGILESQIFDSIWADVQK